jgi:hypothetical protein
VHIGSLPFALRVHRAQSFATRRTLPVAAL